MPSLPELLAKLQIQQRYNLYPGEDEYFKKNQHVGGMAADDNMVILNPYSQLNQQEKQSVFNNEGLRIGMRQVPMTPNFDVTPNQLDFFNNTPYAANMPEMKNTIIARYLTGDPSAQDVTEQQKQYADWLMNYLYQGDY